ncbi:MAG: hypothetical protein ABIH21_05380 [Patescibacteria group bacterium]
MLELINEPIDVLVSFVGNKVSPKRMHWAGKDYDIKTINLVHSAHEGMKRVFYFSVSDFSNYFKLRLDTDSLEWSLVELYTDG